jgi:hypothetical protein
MIRFLLLIINKDGVLLLRWSLLYLEFSSLRGHSILRDK